MAYEENLRLISALKSTADLSSAASQFKLVKLDTAAGVVVSAAAADVSIGILQNKPKATEPAVVALLTAGGIGKAEAGAAVSIGDLLVSDTSGRVITSTPTAADYVVGVALEAATAAGQIIAILFNPYKHAIT